jgi:hypothetical protein
MNITRLLFLTLLTVLCATSMAADVTLAPADLVGKWVVGGKQDCASGTSVYATFRDNGTAEMGRGVEPRSVGFWLVRDNVITVHQLVAPGESDTDNVFYHGRYSYSYLTAEVLASSQDALDIITGTTGNTVRKTLTKCG